MIYAILFALLVFSQQTSARIGFTVTQCDSNFLTDDRVSSSNLRDIPASKDTLPGTQDKYYYPDGAFDILCVFHDGICKEIWYICRLKKGCINQELFKFLVGYINLPGKKLSYKKYSVYTSDDRCVAAERRYLIPAYSDKPLQALWVIDPDYAELLRAHKNSKKSSK